MSEFRVPVVRIGTVTKHPNADSLSIVQVDGENVIFKSGEFAEGDLAVYVPVDAVVPTTVPGTEFLGERPKDRRIRAKRLRGTYSEGLLLPASLVREKALDVEGNDVASVLGIKKHEDEVPESMGGGAGGSVKHGGETESNPGIPVYDVEPLKKHKHLLVEGERVIVTEKLHGTNFRAGAVYDPKTEKLKLYVGSRNNLWKNPWREPTLRERLSDLLFRVSRHTFGKPFRKLKPNIYWLTARQYNLDRLADSGSFGNYVLYGEVFGQVQDLKYGAKEGETWLRIFDVYDLVTESWLDWDDVVDLCEWLDIDTVPVLYDGPYSEAAIEPFVEGKSVVEGADCIREGIVVKPAVTREEKHFGRVILKWVSQAYKLRRGGTELH